MSARRIFFLSLIITGAGICRSHYDIGLITDSSLITRTYNVMHYGVTGDGKTDDSERIQQLLDALPDSGGIVYFPVPSVKYLIRRGLVIVGKKNIILKGEEPALTILEFKGFLGICIAIRKSRNCAVVDLKIIGQQKKVMGLDAAAIKISRSDSVFIRNNIIDGAITNGIEGYLSNHCFVINNTVVNTNNYNGIGWAGGKYNRFSKNYCSNNRGQGIEIRSQQHSVVSDNICNDNGVKGEQSSGITVEAEDGIADARRIDSELIGGSNNIEVRGNHCENNLGAGIYVVSSRNDTVKSILVSANTLIDNSDAGVFLATAAVLQEKRTTRQIRIVNNTFISTNTLKQKQDIWLYFVRDVEVSSNAHSTKFVGVRSDGSLNISSDQSVIQVH